MNNKFFQMVQQMQQYKNPQQAFMGMIQQNPQFQKDMQTCAFAGSIRKHRNSKEDEPTIHQRTVFRTCL